MQRDNLIDQQYLSYISEEQENSNWIEPRLTYNRLDLGIKSYVASFYITNRCVPEYVKRVYSEHISAFTHGSYSEYGNVEKQGINKYFSDFEKIALSIKESGFDDTKSLVPISKNGCILNGAHRVSVSKVLNSAVKTMQTNIEDPQYDYRFFLDRGMDINSVEFMVKKFIEYSDDCFIALVWDAAKGEDEALENCFDKIVYKKTITLNEKASHFLIKECYKNETWIGAQENRFKGVLGKQKFCFPNSLKGNVRIYIFQNDNLENVLKIKDKVRSIFNIGKHSIHITDNNKETIELASYILNENSLDFLNLAEHYQYNDGLLLDFSNKLNNLNLNFDDYVIDSSYVLSLYGLRPAKDLDYLTLSKQIEGKGIDYHGSCLKFYGKSESELIYNPKNYFIYKGVKISSLEVVRQFKINRNEEKDKKDIALIDTVKVSKKFSILKIRSFLLRNKIILLYKLKLNIIKTLDFLKLKKHIKKFLSLLK